MVFEIIGIILAVVILSVVINGIEDYRKQGDDVSMSFKEAMDLAELPVMTFYNGDVKLNFLLDTGSNKNTINSAILGSLDYKKINEEGSPVIGFNGTASIAEFVEIGFTYKNRSYTSKFQVLDMQEAFSQVKAETGVQIHGILGSLFFQEYKYVFDFESLIAYSRK